MKRQSHAGHFRKGDDPRRMAEMDMGGTETEDTMKKEEVEKLILEKGLTLADVIDVVIELNGVIGVGLITLAEEISDYIRETPKRKSASNDSEPDNII